MNYTGGQQHALTHARDIYARMGATPPPREFEQLWVAVEDALFALIAAFEDDCDPPAWVVKAAKCNPADTMDRLRWAYPGGAS